MPVTEPLLQAVDGSPRVSGRWSFSTSSFWSGVADTPMATNLVEDEENPFAPPRRISARHRAAAELRRNVDFMVNRLQNTQDLTQDDYTHLKVLVRKISKQACRLPVDHLVDLARRAANLQEAAGDLGSQADVKTACDQTKDALEEAVKKLEDETAEAKGLAGSTAAVEETIAQLKVEKSSLTGDIDSWMAKFEKANMELAAVKEAARSRFSDCYSWGSGCDKAVARAELIAGIEGLKAVSFSGEERSVWAVPWPNLVYLLQTYSMMMSLVMGVAIFIGVMMQLFLYLMTNANAPDGLPADGSTRSSQFHLLILIICLPIFLFLGCLCIFNSICLLAGQASHVSFARCRAMMFTAYLLFRERKSERMYDYVKRACWWVDFWFSDGFAWMLCLFAVVGGYRILSTSEHVSFGEIYRLLACLWGWPMIGTCIWGVLTMILHILCDLKTGNDKEKDIHNTILSVQTVLFKFNVRPGKMSLHTKMLLDSVGLSCKPREDLPVPSSESMCCFSIFFISFILTAVVLALGIASYKAYESRLMFLGGYISVLLISAWILIALLSMVFFGQYYFPKIFRFTFIINVVIMAFVTDGILCAGLHLVPYFGGKPVAVPLEHGNDPWVYPNETSGRHPKYPACHLRWGGVEEIKVLDLAILSTYAYDSNDTSYQEGGEVWMATNNSFTGKGLVAEILMAQDYWRVGRVVVFRLAAQGAPSGTTVLVVKGSSQAHDFYADAGMWAAIASFQVFMPLIPLLDQLPNWVFAWILRASRRLVDTERNVFGNIHAIYSNLTSDPRYMNDTFMIAGHSLGGGIATAAGGSLGIPAVSFSGPGSHFSRWRFNTTVEKAFRSALTVKPEIDVVHKIDRHDEMSQYVDCRTQDGSYRDFGTCHSIRTTTCELWRVCGDARGRDFKQMCEPVLGDRSHLGAYLGRGRGR